ncbi:MAG TPA: hypothetical protein VE986_04465 [Hyphomicrobiales bacterium]|nr:hypothetical protein [Hyphomicrobiales bacterium]
MKKLMIALAAIIAATLFSGNAFAFSPSQAKGVHASNAVVQVSHYGYRHYYRHRRYRHCSYCYRPCCYSCGCYRSVYYYNGCGWVFGGCGSWGWGFPFFNWFF